MKRLLFASLLLMGCYSLPFRSSCDKDEDQRRVQRAISYMEQHNNVLYAEVRYLRSRNVAIVSGFNANRQVVRSERVPQSCK